VIEDVPVATPLTVPVEEPIVATPVLLLLHVPPDVVELSVVLLPAQMLVVPVIEAGVLFTVNVEVAIQLPILYVIVAVPAPAPVAVPVDEPIVATPVLLLLQVPPLTELVSVELPPTQTDIVPPIDAGELFTVITVDVKHPVPCV